MLHPQYAPLSQAQFQCERLNVLQAGLAFLLGAVMKNPILPLDMCRRDLCVRERMGVCISG